MSRAARHFSRAPRQTRRITPLRSAREEIFYLRRCIIASIRLIHFLVLAEKQVAVLFYTMVPVTHDRTVTRAVKHGTRGSDTLNTTT